MRIGINDLAFFYKFDSLHSAKVALEQYASLCYQIQIAAKNRTYSELEDRPFVTAPRQDTGFELFDGQTLQKLACQLSNRELRSFFLSVLLNSNTPVPPTTVFTFDGKDSYICGYIARSSSIVVSLLSHHSFADNQLCGEIASVPHILKNISKPEHLSIYEPFLGRRIYRPNDNKHKPNRSNNYGGSAPASPMPLSNFEAQELLNRSIGIGRRFYGKLNGHYYTFHCTQDNVYHGFQNDNLPEDIKASIDAHFSIL
mgnify:CR=1 FL=1